MGIQILQYEFLGPVPLSEWGPPMGELVYLVMSREKDRFRMLYAGDCDRTDDRAFFVQHPQFKCWIKESGSEDALHLAVYAVPGSEERGRILGRITSSYRPPCNPAQEPAPPPYRVRSGSACPGCGSQSAPAGDPPRCPACGATC